MHSLINFYISVINITTILLPWILKVFFKHLGYFLSNIDELVFLSKAVHGLCGKLKTIVNLTKIWLNRKFVRRLWEWKYLDNCVIMTCHRGEWLSHANKHVYFNSPCSIIWLAHRVSIAPRLHFNYYARFNSMSVCQPHKQSLLLTGHLRLLFSVRSCSLTLLLKISCKRTQRPLIPNISQCLVST